MYCNNIHCKLKAACDACHWQLTHNNYVKLIEVIIVTLL